MHTPEGTLERGQAPPYTTPGHLQDQPLSDQVQAPHLLSLPNMDDRGNFTNRYLLNFLFIECCDTYKLICYYVKRNHSSDKHLGTV